MSQRLAQMQQIQLSSQAAWEVAAGDYAAAEQTLSTLLAARPTDQNLLKQMAEVRRQAALSANYASIQEAMAQEDWQQTDILLAQVAQLHPGDVTAQALQTLEKALQARSALFQRAEKAYQAGDWAEATVAYETLRDWDSSYQQQTVVAHLADSYVQQGIVLVQSTKGDLDAVQRAIEMYQKALSLQPTLDRAQTELNLAQKYLEGRQLLAQNDLQGALRAWQSIYDQDPNYAGGGVAAFLGFAGPQPTPTVPAPGPAGQ